MKRGRDESNFRAKRSRVHGKNIIRGMALSFSRDNATEKCGMTGKKGEERRGGEIQVIEKLGAFDREDLLRIRI